MVPEGWKLTTLGEVCDGRLQTGPFGSQLHAHEYVENGIPVLMPKDLNNAKASSKCAAKITPEKAAQLAKHKLETGDLLFSRRGDVTRFALIDGESVGSICGTGCLKARPSNKHSPAFLAYFLQKNSSKKWLEKNAVGQTMPNMNTEILRELPLISASSRTEEDKIAEILSTWDKAITTTEQLLANSQQQKKALMQQLLTGKKRLLDENGVRFSGEWKRMHFGEVVTLGKDKFDPKKENSLEECIELEHIEQSTSTVDGSTSTEEATSTKSKFEKNDILFGKLRPYLRKYWLADRAGVCSTEIWVFKTNSSFMLPEYLLQVVQLNSFIDVANKSAGTHMPRADWNVVKDFIIPVPGLSEQKVIADVLSSVQGQMHKLQKKVNILEEEKRALMQQLLTGKCRVKLDREVA